MKHKLALMMALPFTLFGENLSELIKLSQENKLIQASKYSLESIQAEYDSVKDGYMPSLTLNSKYQQTSKETSGVPSSMSSIGASLQYTIYDGGKKDNLYDAYDSSVQGSSKKIEHITNQIALKVTSYYYTYLSLLAQKEAKQQEIEQLNSDLDRINKFFDVGVATNDEVQKIIARQESARVDLSQIELNIQTIIHNLEYTVGKSVDIASGSTIREYISQEANRADIQAMQDEVQKALYIAKSKRGEDYPKVYLDNTFTRVAPSYDSSMYSSSDYNQNIISLNLSWKVFDFGARNSTYMSSYKSYLAMQSQYEDEKNKANVDLKLAIKAYDIAKQKITTARAGVNASNATYDAIKAKYENGLVDNVSYLQALSEKYNAQSVLTSAVYDLEIKKANIIYYSGNKLEEYVR